MSGVGASSGLEGFPSSRCEPVLAREDKTMTTIPLIGAGALEISLVSRQFLIADMKEAISLLEEHWPVKTGVHYRLALRSCRLALLRNGSSTVAREHLIAACLEAGVSHKALSTDQIRL